MEQFAFQQPPKNKQRRCALCCRRRTTNSAVTGTVLTLVTPLTFAVLILEFMILTASKEVAVAVHYLHLDSGFTPYPSFPFQQGLRIGPP